MGGQWSLTRSVCYLGPELSQAWEAKQPWGWRSPSEGEGSGPSKVGGVRVCAPPLLAPKFSPDGPSATVPVLGCSFPEESYPSLANQPSSGAKQGDMQCECGATPRKVVPAPWQPVPPWPPRPAHAWGRPCLLAGLWLLSHILETQVSFPGKIQLTVLDKQARQTVQFQPPEASEWATKSRPQLSASESQRGLSWHKGKRGHSQSIDRLLGLSPSEDTTILAHFGPGNPTSGANIRYLQSEQKREVSFPEQGREILEKAAFRREKKDHRISI